MKQNSDSYARIAITDQIYLLRRISKRIIDTRDQIIFRLFLETGCSTEELINLKPADFEFTTSSIKIGQKQKQRTVKIPFELSLQLNSFINKEQANKEQASKEQKYIFGSRQSTQITKKRVSQIITSHSFSLLNRKMTPTNLRRISIQFNFSRTKSIEQTRKQTGIKTLTDKTYLSEEQLARIKEQIRNKQHQIIFNILAETGCILQELVNVKISDIEFTKNSITIRANNTKNNEQRNSKISPKLSLQIKEFVGENDLSGAGFLLSTRQSPQMSDKRVFQLIRGYAAKAGMSSVSPQIIRNSYIAHAMMAGKALAEIEAQTGVHHLGIHHYGLIKRKQEQRA